MTYTSGGMYGTKTMAYNDGNYMTSITHSGTTDSYYYTADGRRYRASFAGAAYRYCLYNGERVLEELGSDGSMQARYTTENGSYYRMLLHLHRPTGTLSRFPVYDNIGTVRGLVDASGAVTDTYEFDTFGRSVSSSGTTPNPYRYGGAWGYITDPSGMLQLGVRHYWPEVGAFLQQDPVRGSRGAYLYASDNPVTHLDPTGMFDWGGFWSCLGQQLNPFGVSSAQGTPTLGLWLACGACISEMIAGTELGPAGWALAASTQACATCGAGLVVKIGLCIYGNLQPKCPTSPHSVPPPHPHPAPAPLPTPIPQPHPNPQPYYPGPTPQTCPLAGIMGAIGMLFPGLVDSGLGDLLCGLLR